MKTILATTILCGCLSACTTTMVAYEAAALKSIRAAEDNNIAVWTVDACGTPYSAAIRNPQIVPALKALCLPAGLESSPVTLLDNSRLNLTISAPLK